MTERTNDESQNLEFQTGKIIPIAFAHFIHDTYSSFLAPLLPKLIEKMALSLTMAGSLRLFVQLPSILNPFLGAFVDKRQLNRMLLVVTPGLTGLMMCMIGLAPNYAVLIMLLLTVGISVAGIHVSGPVIISRLAGKSIGRGMSFWMLGGEFARTVGPIIAVWAVARFGLEGLWQLFPVGVATSLVLWWKLEPTSKSSTVRASASFRLMLLEMRSIMTGIFGIMVSRAFMAAALTTFLPTYLYQQGHSLWFSGISLSVYELAGAVGVLIAGTMSDTIGRRKVLNTMILIAPVFMFLMLYVEGVLLFVVLLALGFSTLATGPVMMAAVLENAGANRASANGMFMAINFTVRAVIVLLVGIISDFVGLRIAFHICGGVAVLGLAFVKYIPED